VIESVGAGVTDLKVGDRVVASCGHNGAREKIALPANTIVKIPDNLDFDRAAGIIIIYGTALHALEDRASPKPGETLAVLGAAGGTGLAACELGKLMGLKVIACASSDEKLEFAKAHGAELTLNYSTEDLKEGLRRLTGGKGVDIIFDPVGGTYAEAALRSIAWEGRFLVIGFAAGDIPKMPLNLALLKGCDIRGVFWGAWTRLNAEKNRANLEKTREVDCGRQDLLACRPHLPAGANRRSVEGPRRPQGDGQSDPASVRVRRGNQPTAFDLAPVPACRLFRCSKRQNRPAREAQTVTAPRLSCTRDNFPQRSVSGKPRDVSASPSIKNEISPHSHRQASFFKPIPCANLLACKTGSRKTTRQETGVGNAAIAF